MGNPEQRVETREKVKNSTIENIYKTNIDLIIGYLKGTNSDIAKKLSSSQKNINKNDKLLNKEEKIKEINAKLEKLKTSTDMTVISSYLQNAKIVYGKIEDEEKMGLGLTINILDEKEYATNNKGSLGCYNSYTETIYLPKGVSESTMLHEIIHALSFRFDMFFYNQISLDSERLKKIQAHIYDNNKDDLRYEQLLGNFKNLLSQGAKNNYAEGKKLAGYQKDLIAMGKGFTRRDINDFIDQDEPSFDGFVSRFNKGDYENIIIDDSNKQEIEKKLTELLIVHYKEIMNNYIHGISIIMSYKTDIEKLQHKQFILGKRKREEQIKYLTNIIEQLSQSMDPTYKQLKKMACLGRIDDMNIVNALHSITNMTSDQIRESYRKLQKSIEGISVDNAKNPIQEMIDLLYAPKLAEIKSAIEKIDHDLAIIESFELDQGMGYMGTFEIVARFRQMRGDLVKEGIIKTMGDKITVENIEKLIKMKKNKGQNYTENQTYDLLDNIELDGQGKIKKPDDLEFIKMIVGMNNEEIVENTEGINKENLVHKV